MSAYVAPERVKAARELDLFSYLQSREPNELVRDGPNAYRLRSHDSLKISNGKWCWWSRGVGGRSALDFLITVRGMDLPHAVEMIEGVHGLPPILPSKPPPQEPKLLKLPPPYRNNQLAVRYLMGRGIQREVMKYCLEHRLVLKKRATITLFSSATTKLASPARPAYAAPAPNGFSRMPSAATNGIPFLSRPGLRPQCSICLRAA